MQPPTGYGQPDAYGTGAKVKNKYPSGSIPSTGLSQPFGGAVGSYGGGMDFSKNSGSGWGQPGGPGSYSGGSASGPSYGGQMQIQPTVQGPSPQVDPVAQERIRRRRLLQQQQMLAQQSLGQGLIGQQIQPTRSSAWQIPGAQVENRYPQNVTQPFPVQNPWQQNVPQNFNQGTEYNPFVRRW